MAPRTITDVPPITVTELTAVPAAQNTTSLDAGTIAAIFFGVAGLIVMACIITGLEQKRQAAKRRAARAAEEARRIKRQQERIKKAWRGAQCERFPVKMQTAKGVSDGMRLPRVYRRADPPSYQQMETMPRLPVGSRASEWHRFTEKAVSREEQGFGTNVIAEPGPAYKDTSYKPRPRHTPNHLVPQDPGNLSTIVDNPDSSFYRHVESPMVDDGDVSLRPDSPISVDISEETRHSWEFLRPLRSADQPPSLPLVETDTTRWSGIGYNAGTPDLAHPKAKRLAEKQFRFSVTSTELNYESGWKHGETSLETQPKEGGEGGEGESEGELYWGQI